MTTETSAQDRARLLRLNELVGQSLNVIVPGEVLLDLDGIPAGVTASRHLPALTLGAVIASTELDRAGLTPEDVPNLKIIYPEGDQS